MKYEIPKIQKHLSIYIAIIFIVFFTMGYFCVWTHDDLVTPDGSITDFIHESLYFGNGRYFGNFLVNLCLNHKILDAFTRSAVITVIIAFIADIAYVLNIKTLSLSLFLFAGMGNVIYSQVITWGHGFYNYVPPIALMLFAVKLLKDHYIRNKKHNMVILTVLLFVVGVSQQLFAENTTCIAVLISLIIFLFSVKAHGKEKIPAAVYFLGSVTGAAIMFALPVIMGVSYKMHEYRGNGIGAETIADFLQMAGSNLRSCLNAMAGFTSAWILLSFAFIIIIRKYSLNNRTNRIYKKILYPVFSVFPFVSLFYFIINGRHLKERIPFTNIHINGINDIVSNAVFVAFVLYLVFVVFFLFLYRNLLNGDKRIYFVLLLLCAASIAELLIVTRMGGRCLFLTDVLISVFTIYILSKENVISDKLCTICGVSGLLVIGGIVALLVSVWHVNNYRFDYAREQLNEGKKVIEIIKLPHERWLADPNGSYAFGYYFNNGEIKPEEDFSFITLDDYLEKKNQ